VGTTTVKVTRRNQISLPAEVRRELGIKPGDPLAVEVSEGKVVLRPKPASVADELRNLAPELWRGMDGAKYLRELREEWSHREP
jgi:antitoxin PrlF